jgi:hypothetical protein
MDLVLIGTPENLAARLARTWIQAPWHEFCFYHRLLGVPHGRAMEQLELVVSKLLPAVRAARVR